MLNIKKSTVASVLIAGTIFTAVAGGLGGFYLILNREYLRQSLNKEKLTNERLLNEKLVAEKNLEYTSKELKQLKRSNQQLTTHLGNSVSESDFKSNLIRDLGTNQKEIQAIRNSINKIDAESDLSDQKIAKLTKSLDQLIAKNQQLTKQIQQLALESSQKNISDVVTIHKGIGRSFRIEALRGRAASLTTKAKKTDKIVVSFEPTDRHEFMKIKKDVFYVIMSDQSGAIYNLLQSQKQTVHLDGNPVDIMPSFEIRPQDSEQVNRISLTLENLEGLQPGVYLFDVYTNNAYVGNAQIRLN